MPTSIPPDLVHIILHFLHQSHDAIDAKSFTSALCVSPQWRDVGLRLIWTDVVIDSTSRLKSFVKSFVKMPNSFNLEQMKALTLNFNEQERRSIRQRWSVVPYKRLKDMPPIQKEGRENEIQEFKQALTILHDLLPLMSNLTSFSFYIHPRIRPRPLLELYIPHILLYRIITNLPSSIRHLEVDSKGREIFSTEDAKLDICTAISQRFGVLISLRLRLKRLCPNLIKPCSTLRSLVVNMAGSTYRDYVLQCPSQYPRQHVGELVTPFVKKAARVQIVKLLSSSLQNFPNLEKCMVLDNWAMVDRHGRIIDMLHVRDLLKDQTTTYPLFPVIPLRSPWAIEGLRIMRQPGRNGYGRDVLGNMGELDEAAESHCWQSTASGLRLPGLLKDTMEGRRHEWVDPEQQNISKEEILQLPDRSREFVPALKWPYNGRRSLQAKVDEGVGEVGPFQDFLTECDSDDSEFEPDLQETLLS